MNMKLTNIKNKAICFLLAFTLVLQSCSVYKKTSVNLEEAYNSDTKVLIVKIDNTKLKFNRIKQYEGNYYGTLKTKGHMDNVPLVESDIKSIRVLDKTTTTIGNLAIIIGSVGIVFLVIAAIELSNWDFDSGTITF